jgi:hypothetical protein
MAMAFPISSRGRKLAGLRVNVAKRMAGSQRLFPNEMPEDPEGFKPGTEIHRNRDQAFERLLEKDSAERRIDRHRRTRRNRRRLSADAA